MNWVRPSQVYALTDESGWVIYIGCTIDLRDRLATHRRCGVAHHRCVVLSEHEDRKEAIERERFLIEELDPPANVQWTSRCKRHKAAA